jgi:hypothetical protein
MTPRNRPNGGFPRRAALAVLLFTGLACATPKPVYKGGAKDRAAATYTFTVGFVNECPKTVTSDFANCNPSLPPNSSDPKQPKDCARPTRNEKVTFVSSPAGKAFAVQFDPFGMASIRVDGSLGPLPIAPAKDKAPDSSRTFTFRVTAGNCDPVDPQIIIDW